MKLSILFIVPAYYDELRAKGVEGMIFERDEGGFFDKVITVHPFSNKTRVILHSQTHEIHEVGFNLIPGSDRFRLLRYFQLPLHFIRIVWTVVRLCRIFRIDLIRANDPFWMGLFALIGSRICGIPFCVSIHADYDKLTEVNPDNTITRIFGSYRLAKRMSRIIFSQAAMIMPISQCLARKAAQWGAEPRKIQLIRHGIDLSSFNYHPKNNIRNFFRIDCSKKIVGIVSRLDKDKYIYDVLKIARILAKRRDDFVIIMAGGGSEENNIRIEVSLDEVLKNCIVISGFQPRDICLDLGRAAEVSICLLAGFSLIEACASGRPVVAYDVEWHSELIENEVTGLLVSENNFIAAAEKIDWLFDHPIEAAVMGEKAMARVFEQFSIDSASARKIECYQQLLARTS